MRAMLLLTILLAGMGAVPAEAAPTVPASGLVTATSCMNIRQADFSKVRDAPTQIVATAMTVVDEGHGSVCRISGYVAPQVGIELRLPVRWNGKLVSLGCGSYCGDARDPQSERWCDEVVARGYACASSDAGHRGQSSDSLWAYGNLQAQLDFGVRAAHVTALAAKAIVAQLYGMPARRSYFVGCSTGGRQGMVEAQRFPWDFDGIVAMDPTNFRCTGVTFLWDVLVGTDAHGASLFTNDDIRLIHAAVLAKCDANDGLQDGLIGDPRACRFDPVELRCRAGGARGCLSAAQVAAARKLYSGPVTSTGERLFAGGAMLGSELGPDGTGSGAFRQDPRYKADFWRYMGFAPPPGPDWRPADFNFDTDPKRTGVMDTLMAGDNPDLRGFAAAGGKLIIAQGWYSSGGPLPLNTVDFFETIERTVGGRERARGFVRLFMVPGWDHCSGGDGATSVDYLGAIDAWVEQGKAPDMLVGAHVGDGRAGSFLGAPTDVATVRFTRPHFPYPLQARYKGSGDPNDYRSFKAVPTPAYPSRAAS